MGIGLVLVSICLYLLEARFEILEMPFLVDIDSEKGLRLKDIHFTQDDPDKEMNWILDAKEVKFSKDRSFFTFKTFRLKLNPREGPSIELKGNWGEYDKNSGEINLHGDLQGHTDNGYKIITQHILYKQKEGYLTTDDLVEISGPFFSLAGRGLYVNPEKEILRIISDVTTQINGGSLTL